MKVYTRFPNVFKSQPIQCLWKHYFCHAMLCLLLTFDSKKNQRAATYFFIVMTIVKRTISNINTAKLFSFFSFHSLYASSLSLSSHPSHALSKITGMTNTPPSLQRGLWICARESVLVYVWSPIYLQHDQLSGKWSPISRDIITHGSSLRPHSVQLSMEPESNHPSLPSNSVCACVCVCAQK